MKRTGTGKNDWSQAAMGAALVMVLTGLLYFGPFYYVLADWSYDFTFLFKPRVTPNEVLLIYMDEQSSMDLRQQAVTWDRGLHARLLDRLREGGAPLVVFDVWFGPDPGSDVTNRMLAAAMRQHSKVVLAAADEEEKHVGTGIHPVRPPLDLFQEAAAGWGIVGVVGEKHEIIRRYHPGTEQEPSMPWEAFRLAAGLTNTTPRTDLTGQWLNYYGPPGTLRSVSYQAALTAPLSMFADRFVFIGLRSNTPYPRSVPDQFRSPYSRWQSGGYLPGVDLAATAFLNLYRKEWLTEVPDAMTLLLLLTSAALLGFGFSFLRLRWVLVVTVLLLLALAFLSALLMHYQHFWFPWLIIAVVQVPLALAWRALARRLYASTGAVLSSVESDVVFGDETVTVVAPPSSRPAAAGGEVAAARRGMAAPAVAGPGARGPRISDHELLRCVGRGAYGEVWLARDVIGSFHVVKLVYRSTFDSETPFEREFRGMQRFTPLSRNHPGWVQILHVGRDEAEGFFYYIMEAADDEMTGQEIQPDTYQPRTLARDLKKQRRLPLAECLEVGRALADALDYLHGQLLVHRDIKPSNVIFVHGAPKFTDIGLITEARNRDHSVSVLGTEGYIAPEGPGAAAADIYSLGKLLYEISTGHDRFAFPATPDSLVETAHPEARRGLAQIIAKACEKNPASRHASAAELRDALRALQTLLVRDDSGNTT